MQDAWSDVFTWPLLVFLVSACMYPLASSCAHTFSTMSARARHVCFFFDYGALSFYSLGESGGRGMSAVKKCPNVLYCYCCLRRGDFSAILTYLCVSVYVYVHSTGSAMTYSAYVVPDKWVNSTFHLCYIPIAVFNTVICTGLACYSR